jgi:hypothetical protein
MCCKGQSSDTGASSGTHTPRGSVLVGPTCGRLEAIPRRPGAPPVGKWVSGKGLGAPPQRDPAQFLTISLSGSERES